MLIVIQYKWINYVNYKIISFLVLIKFILIVGLV